MEADPKNSQQAPKWLTTLQKNSWEPEVIISGITLAFIFAIPNEVYNFAARLVQESGVNYLGGLLVLMYLSLVANVFKLFFMIHLALRFTWAAILGMSYAYPDGVIKGKLFKLSQNVTYRTPTQLVIEYERICSAAFGFPLIFALSVIPITLYLLFLGLLYQFFGLSFFVVYLIFMISLIGLSIASLVLKNSYFVNKLRTSLSSTLGAIYQSHLGKWKMIGYLGGSVLITIPFVLQDLSRFKHYFNEVNVAKDDQKWISKEHYYDSYRNPGERIPRISLESDQVEGKHIFRLAYFKEDESFVEKYQTSFQTMLDTLEWAPIQSTADLYRIYVNDSLHVAPFWKSAILPVTQQKVLETVLDFSYLPPGAHQLRVEKLIVALPILDAGNPKHRKQWATCWIYRL